MSFEVNEDKSITINGTATEDTEFVLNGSLTSTDILFFLRKNQDYMQCGLADGVSINLYNFDGTDRSLISSLGNGTINLNSTSYITYVTLNISSGTKFKNVTIYPMIKAGVYSSDIEYEYKQCEENEVLNIDLGEYAFENDDNILIDRTSYIFTKNIYLYPSNDLYPSDDLFPIDYDEEISGSIATQKTFQGKTLIQCDKNISLIIKYFSKDYLNEKFSQIQVEQDEIKLEVGKKVNNEDFTGAKILLQINNDESEARIEADKININGTVSANGNFIVDTNGNMSCTNANVAGTVTSSNATITGGTINLIGTNGGNGTLDVKNINGTAETFIASDGVYSNSSNGNRAYLYANNDEVAMYMAQDGSNTRVKPTGITTPVLTQTSKESVKKNIVEYSEKALNIVKDSEIYEYNFKSENDENKKHIGFVIGDEGGEYKTPEQVISNDREGIDTYSMCSILWKAVQEQQKTIEELTKEIELLKGEK